MHLVRSDAACDSILEEQKYGSLGKLGLHIMLLSWFVMRNIVKYR
jgi:hypothetical protein